MVEDLHLLRHVSGSGGMPGALVLRLVRGEAGGWACACAGGGFCAPSLWSSPPEAEVVGDEISRLRREGNFALRPWSPHASCSVFPVVGLGSVSVEDYRLRARPQCRILSVHCTGASCPCCSMLLTQAAVRRRETTP